MTRSCANCGSELETEGTLCTHCHKADPAGSPGPVATNIPAEKAHTPNIGTRFLHFLRRERLNLVFGGGFIILFATTALYALDLSGWMVLWLLPLVIGASIPIFKMTPVASLEDRLSNWIAKARENAAASTGKFRRYGYRPFMESLFKIRTWTLGISDRYFQVGVRLAAYLYASLIVVTVLLIALYAIAVVVITILIILVALWVFAWWANLSSPGDESPQPSPMPLRPSMGDKAKDVDESPQPPAFGFEKGRVVKEGLLSEEELYRVDEQGHVNKPGFIFDQPTGYRVDKEGSVYKEGFVFDQKIHEVNEDGTIVDVTGFFRQDTGYRIGEDGRIYKKGALFEEDTGIRIKPDHD